MKEIYVNSVARYDDSLNIKELIPDANMRRRMSKIVKMGVATGRECLQKAEINSPSAIVTATGYGCLADSEKFLRAIISTGETQLPPTPFIQSTFNTIGSQLAILCDCRGYNMTFVNRFSSFDDALIDSILAIGDGEENVLLVAADEMTPTLSTILRRMNLPSNGEGAAAILLSSEPCATTFGVVESISLNSNSQIYNEFPTHSAQEFLSVIETLPIAHRATFANGRFSAELRCY